MDVLRIMRHIKRTMRKCQVRPDKGRQGIYIRGSLEMIYTQMKLKVLRPKNASCSVLPAVLKIIVLQG